jgi:hypothetical protein
VNMNLVIVRSRIVIIPACVARRKRGWALLFAIEDSTGAMMMALSMRWVDWIYFVDAIQEQISKYMRRVCGGVLFARNGLDTLMSWWCCGGDER